MTPRARVVEALKAVSAAQVHLPVDKAFWGVADPRLLGPEPDAFVQALKAVRDELASARMALQKALEQLP